MERVKGIEPSYAAWEAAVLPLNYTRLTQDFIAKPGSVTTIEGLKQPSTPIYRTIYRWHITRTQYNKLRQLDVAFIGGAMKSSMFGRRGVCMLAIVAGAAEIRATPIATGADGESMDHLQSPSRHTLQLAQRRQCEKRAGPFISQSTAWQKWREAQGLGYAVSQSVFPCYDQSGSRGYCFNVFHPC